jgi:hypothetical protein
MVERFNIIFLWLLTKEFHIPKLWDKRSTKKKTKTKTKGVGYQIAGAVLIAMGLV